MMRSETESEMTKNREEMMVETTYNVREDRDCRTNTRQQLHDTGNVYVKRYRATTVCLVLLYIFLLTAKILMCVQTKLSTVERNQILTNISNITDQRNQLLINMTNQRNQLLTNINNLIQINEDLSKELIKTWDVLIGTDGWLYNKYSFYFISTEKKNWTDSRRYCRERNADLIIINNENERQWVKHVRGDDYWIGLNDIDEEGRWKWVDGTELKSDSSFWHKREPNGDRAENCARVNQFQWADYPCSFNFKWICEKRLNDYVKKL